MRNGDFEGLAIFVIIGGFFALMVRIFIFAFCGI